MINLYHILNIILFHINLNYIKISNSGNVCVKIPNGFQTLIHCQKDNRLIQKSKIKRNSYQIDVRNDKICQISNATISCESLNGKKTNQYSQQINNFINIRKIIIGQNVICGFNIQNVYCFGSKELQSDFPFDSQSQKQQISNMELNDTNICLSYIIRTPDFTHKIYCWGDTSNGINNVPDRIKNQSLIFSHKTYLIMGPSIACAFIVQTNSTIQGCWGSCTSNLCDIPEQKGFVTSAAVGSVHSCLISSREQQQQSNGVLICWGSNDSGQLSTPDEFLHYVIQVDVNVNMTCALKSNQRMQCWGGQVELFIEAKHLVQFIATGGRHTCAINAGEQSCWGSSEQGQTQLGEFAKFENNNSDISAGWDFTCFKDYNKQLKCVGFNFQGQTNSILLDEDEQIDMLRSGLNHSCVLLYCERKDTTKKCIKCWGGQNEYGQNDVPDEIQQNHVNSISLGHDFTCTLDQADLNLLKCFGNNDQGQILNISTDVVITEVATGGAHGCYLKQDTRDNRNVECWGSDSNGQLIPPSTVAYSNVVALGDAHGCVLEHASRGVVCWGGWQLRKTGVYADRLATAQESMCIVNVEQERECWGDNEWGQCKVPKSLSLSQLAL